jgi:hypothetical protein
MAPGFARRPTGQATSRGGGFEGGPVRTLSGRRLHAGFSRRLGFVVNGPVQALGQGGGRPTRWVRPPPGHRVWRRGLL